MYSSVQVLCPYDPAVFKYSDTVIDKKKVESVCLSVKLERLILKNI